MQTLKPIGNAFTNIVDTADRLMVIHEALDLAKHERRRDVAQAAGRLLQAHFNKTASSDADYELIKAYLVPKAA